MHITTSRLVLRFIQPEDWQAVRHIWLDFAQSPFAQYDKPHNTDPEDVRARIARWAAATSSGMEHIFFAACLDGRVIGYIAFNARAHGHEIGYCFHSAYHGRGYAKEALAAAIACLGSLGVTHFTAGTALANTPSVRLLTSLDFRLTGTEQVSFYKDEQGAEIVFAGGVFALDPAK